MGCSGLYMSVPDPRGCDRIIHWLGRLWQETLEIFNHNPFNPFIFSGYGQQLKGEAPESRIGTC